MTAITQLRGGQPVEGIYAVRRKDRRITRKGDPYLSLLLADATGAIAASIFNQVDFFAGQFAQGDRVRIAGRVEEHNGRLSIAVNHIRPATEEVAAAELLPRSHRDPEELFGFVLHLADEIAADDMRRLLGHLTGDPQLTTAWKSVPCSRSGHHAYMGGLIEHTVGTAALAQTLCTWHPRLDADLLVTAALVHDLGYTRSFRLGATFEITDEGRLLGHLAVGTGIVDRAARTCKLSDERRLALLHTISWHHGPPADQAPAAAEPEALALWRINQLEIGVKGRLEGEGTGV